MHNSLPISTKVLLIIVLATGIGYNWLTYYNLLIDWVLDSCTFCPILLGTSTLHASLAHAASVQPAQTLTVPKVSLINTATFMYVSKLSSSEIFCIHLTMPQTLA